ncbi:MAG TPA: mannitol dehydrogenase family protein [Candidatus Limiplasma sp.]|nr:mannitol dehydrogenase family protein [Candidatus Limiplasma sp.]HPS81228.1 mannitol dehydrogenase family protein [Candidatus Limiplasma sp.]
MKLSLNGLTDQAYAEHGYQMPTFDVRTMRERTAAAPTWVHFGAGNILRAFPCVLAQKLLDRGELSTGLVVVESYDEEIIDRAFTPFDNLCLAVSLKSDGTVDKRVVASVAEALGYHSRTARVEEILTADSLQMVSMTITEKGYAVLDAQGNPLERYAGDFASMDAPVSIIGILTRLLYLRYQSGQKPLAMVSLDNCSHNGTILFNSVLAIAKAWVERGLADEGFLRYLSAGDKVSFTWSMIDKITPRPSEEVIAMLEADGFEGAQVVVTAKNTYVSAMVNAEECEYLAIEDHFPNGRPPLEKVGVIFSDRETVDKIEKMKVCTCLNPLHTCLAIFGCMLGYQKISDEMKDSTLVDFIREIGYTEGLPVVVDPGIMSARGFIDEVVEKRLPNPFVPDTPQRIACDTSKKIPVRYGETLKAYRAAGKEDLSFLTFIPLVFAGYARYVTGVNDAGEAFQLSPDPNLPELTALLEGFALGSAAAPQKLRALFSRADIFGLDLYSCGLGEKAEGMFAEMSAGKGAIRATVEKYLRQAAKENRA